MSAPLTILLLPPSLVIILQNLTMYICQRSDLSLLVPLSALCYENKMCQHNKASGGELGWRVL